MKRTFRYLTLALVIVALIIGGGCARDRDPDEVFSMTAELRRLSPKSEMKCQFITPQELRDRFAAIFEEDYPQEEVAIDQEVYVLLDLMGEDQDLYAILLDVYSEQVIGFYDDELKELYVVSKKGELGPLEEIVLAHEYTHALQDQYFDLSSLPLEEEGNSDLSIAVLSLVEGDASLVQGIYMWTILDDSEREALSQQLEELEDEAFDAAPRVIQKNLIFPYESGLNFVMALIEQDGWDVVDQAYSDPPQSTEQILHPEKYLERDEPQAIEMPDLENALGGGWKQVDSDVLGEFNIRIYLETFVDTAEAATAAEGWDGDRYVYLKDTDDRKLLVLNSLWDSVSDSQEFFDAYITFVQEKSGGAWTLYLTDVGKRWWETEGLSLYLSQKESEVLLIMAPDRATTEEVLAEFPEF
ncbi:MAG: hypothetical protein E3J34_03060 [Dehalococcoidia bacterium]|nr:MAG: hypothetical protein E3J34_03060 [Dehalococcoidia bacterium]